MATAEVLRTPWRCRKCNSPVDPEGVVAVGEIVAGLRGVVASGWCATCAKVRPVDPDLVAEPETPVVEEDPAWASVAYTTIREIARKRESFTADDVWDALTSKGVIGPREPRAIGAAIRQAHATGIIAATDVYRVRDRSVNASPQRVWASLIWSAGS